MVRKIVSGGQTGVDRAALDFALALEIPVGGWCPRGRRAEDGPIPEFYPLCETPSSNYRQRTQWNVRDSDGTLILCRNRPTGGTLLTCRIAATLGMHLHLVDLTRETNPGTAWNWIRENQIQVLNVAGPRSSENVGIYHQALTFLHAIAKEGHEDHGNTFLKGLTTTRA